MASEWFYIFTAAERQALAGVGSRARAMYEVLAFQMDFETGLVGRRTPISWDGLAWELREEVPRGRGCQILRPTLQEMRTAVERLIGRGLLKRVGIKDFLCFLCPLSRAASVRSNQTQQSGNSPLSTVPNSREHSNGAGFDGFDNTRFTVVVLPNSTDISKVSKYTTPQSSSTDSTGVDADFDEAARGVNRDRPQAASQASPACCRSGNDEKSVHRDRAAPSEARGGAQPVSALIHVGASVMRDGSAAGGGDVSPPTAPMQPVQVLADVMRKRGVRVPIKPDALIEWVAMGVTPIELDQAIERGQRLRAEEGSTQPLNVKWLGSIIASRRADEKRALEAARKLAARPKRRAAAADVEDLARRYGVPGARPGESEAAFRARVVAAVEAVQHG